MHLSTPRFALTGLLALGLLACKKQDETPHEVTYTVSTVAGTGTAGRTDGAVATATFNLPNAIAIDGQGTLYVSDTENNCIRKITPAGVVSTLAGSGTAGLVDGPAATAQFEKPAGIAVDAQGTVYVADANNNCIRKITAAGIVSTLAGSASAGLADGPGSTARFYLPEGLTIDAQGNLYVADSYNNRVRKITPLGVVSTVAGSGPQHLQQGAIENFADGPITTARFSYPFGVAVDGQGTLYVADLYNNRIRKITPAGIVSTVAGSTNGFADGTGTQAKFSEPTSVAVDGSNTIYVADYGNNCLRRISPSGQVSLFAGAANHQGFADGPVATSLFKGSISIITVGNDLYIADSFNHRIRKITAQ